MAAATASRKKTTRSTPESARSNGTSAAGAVAGAARWTEAQVQTLIDAVNASETAKAGFAVAAGELGKSVGTVQQKYYALKRATGGGRKGSHGRASQGAGGSSAARMYTATPSEAQLRALTVDQLTALAQHVKSEVDRRRIELDRAAQLFG